MGKTLKGKECGKGICQRKDGKYSARFCGKNGVRKESIFPHFQKHETGSPISSIMIGMI